VTPSDKSSDGLLDERAASAGLLALMADQREARLQGEDSEVKTEVLLERADLSIAQMARLLDKKPDAIRKTLQRARKK
jgi:DNA-directed RNA polymerase specialized sigma24 family protein